jgi:phosphotransferase system HPr (HPr) family protein
MVETFEIEVRNPSGLHARPAAVFVKAAAASGADVRVANLTTGGPEVNAKSIIAVLGIGVLRGHRIRVTCDGDTAAAAAGQLRDVIASGLGEGSGDS